PATANGGISRPRHSHHQSEGSARPGLSAPPPLSRAISISRSSAARRNLAPDFSGEDADRGTRHRPACTALDFRRKYSQHRAERGFRCRRCKRARKDAPFVRRGAPRVREARETIDRGGVGRMAMKPRAIDVHIEELVLHGFSPSTRWSLADALESE